MTPNSSKAPEFNDENANIKVGDVVVLKSGGPQMTVSALYSMEAQCTWFDGKQVKSLVFPLVAIQKYEIHI